MQIDLLSALPDILETPLNTSIIKKARKKKVVNIFIHNLRNFSTSKQKQIDDYQFGGGAGMVLQIQPIFDAISYLKSKRTYDEVIFMTPDAPIFTQKDANQLSNLKNIIILSGHYKGIDQRVRDNLITKEFSIGKFVLSGGELASLILVDSIVRLLPGAISDSTSALEDSFQDDLLSAPIYTRPADFNSWKVPEVLRSGNFKEIDKWRQKQALEKTKKFYPELLD